MSRDSDAFGTLGCIALVLLINLTIGGLATEYVIEFWGSWAKDVPLDVPFLPCALAGLFVGQFTVPLAIVTWLLGSLIIGWDKS